MKLINQTFVQLAEPAVTFIKKSIKYKKKGKTPGGVFPLINLNLIVEVAEWRL
jgi:phage FluMu protein Com